MQIKDTKQLECIVIIQILGVIACALMIEKSNAMWVAMIGSWFVGVVAIANTWRHEMQRWSYMACWVEAAVLCMIVVAATKDASIWALIGVRLGGLLITFACIGQKKHLSAIAEEK